MTKKIAYNDQIAVETLTKESARFSLEFPADALSELAARLAIPLVSSLSGTLGLAHRNNVVEVRGEFSSVVQQICVVSLEPFTAEIKEEIDLDLVSVEEAEAREEAGALWDPDEREFDVLEGRMVTPGEILAQTLSLALDDHPRKPDSELMAENQGVSLNEGPLKKENPFTALKGMIKEKNDKA